jgi:hypothetical protein
MLDEPNISLTVLITRTLVTAWAIYAIWRTNYNESVFKEIIYNSGTPCSINLFPDYFRMRVYYEASFHLLLPLPL